MADRDIYMRGESRTYAASVVRSSTRAFMPSDLDSAVSSDAKPSGQGASGWFKLGLVAAASALAGGLAAAWWHRKTLAKLRQVEENASNPNFRISAGDPPDEA